jgi:transcriptional regulator with XRE-family HTH domain
MNNWNKRITLAREAAGISKTKLALQVGVSNATVSDWESGVIKKLEGENLLKICDQLNISPRWLQFGEGEMKGCCDDKKIIAVLQAMQSLPEYKKDILVQTSSALAESDTFKNTGTQ